MFGEGRESGARAGGPEESGGRVARFAAALKRLDAQPGLVEATTRWLLLLEREGVDAALDALRGMPEHSTTGRTRP